MKRVRVTALAGIAALGLTAGCASSDTDEPPTNPDAAGSPAASATPFPLLAGKLLARIPVGSRPHGLAVWPQPGRYSLGHTGNIR